MSTEEEYEIIGRIVSEHAVSQRRIVLLKSNLEEYAEKLGSLASKLKALSNNRPDPALHADIAGMPFSEQLIGASEEITKERSQSERLAEKRRELGV